MKRWLALPVLLLAALALAATSLADDGHGKGKGKEKEHGAKGAKPQKQHGGKLGPFSIVSSDNGSCAPPPGHEWATLFLQRTYKVHDNGNGTFRVRVEDKGTFVTRNERSPGACETTDTHHGHLIVAGIRGKIHGYLEGTVTGTFNPNATCPADCTKTNFLLAFFGQQGVNTFTCFQGYAGCRFSFEYTAQRQQKQALLFHHWVDRGTDGVTEVFKGDIATS